MYFRYYVLEGKKTVQANVLEWGEMFENFGSRVVKQESVRTQFVSTVFLGLDHNWSNQGPPLLFETMIFDQLSNIEYCKRCSTWEQAEIQHKKAVEYAKNRRSFMKEILLLYKYAFLKMFNYIERNLW